MGKSLHCVSARLFAIAIWGVLALPAPAFAGGGGPGASPIASASGTGVNANAGTSNIEQDKAPPSADLPPALLPQLTVVPASEDQILIPGAVLNSNRTRHVSLLEMQERKLAEEQGERRERIQRRTRERLMEIQRNGGWPTVFAAQLAKARQEGVPMNREQTAAAQAFLEEFALCQRPAIADATSEFQVFSSFQPSLGPVDMDLVIEPFAVVFIEGCLFGNDAGEVRLLLNGAPGGFITLSSGADFWSDTYIGTSMPLAPGFPDQPAQLVVIRKDGTATDPFPVQFVQRRVVARFDPATHLQSVAAASTALTSQDQLRVVQFAGNPPFSDFAASHWTICCNVVTGTDRWFMQLKNGWHVPVPGETTVLPQQFNLAIPVIPGDAIEFDKDQGFTTCGLFSSWPGWIMSTSVNTPADFPQFQQEFDVTWQAGSNCSGIVYQVGLIIVGPEGVPYD